MGERGGRDKSHNREQRGKQSVGDFLSDAKLEALYRTAEQNEKIAASFQEQAEAVRQLLNYQAFKESFQEGDIDLQYLVEKFEGATEPPAFYDTEDIPAANQLIADIRAGLVAPPSEAVLRAKATTSSVDVEGVEPPVETTTPESKDFKNLEKSPAYEVLSQLYIQGMEAEDIESRLLMNDADIKAGRANMLLERLGERYGDFKQVKREMSGRQWNDAVRTFTRWLKEENFDPAARFVTEYIIEQPKVKFADLNAEDKEKAKERLLDKTREIWQPFFYSGKWRLDESGKPRVTKETDLDAKLSLYLFERAGITGIKDAMAVAPGRRVEGATNIDTGGIAGARMERGKPGQRPTLRLDNHQPWRSIIEGSSAKTIYRLLNALEVPEMKDDALRAMVELSVADDNSRLITNKREFFRSYKTLSGLHRHFIGSKEEDAVPGVKFERGIDALHDYVAKAWKDVGGGSTPTEGRYQQSQDWWAAYRKVLNREFTSEEIKEYGLTDQQKYRRFVIGRATEVLNKPWRQLEKEGRLIFTDHGKYIVDIPGMLPSKKSFRGGHQAVAAFGFDGMVSYNEPEQSLLVNTLRHDTDMSKVWRDNEGHDMQGDVVRGILAIKPGSDKPLKVGLRDIFHVLSRNKPIEPKGFVEEYLKHGLPKKNVQSSAKEKQSDAAVKNHTDVSPALPSASKTYDEAWKALNLFGKNNLSAKELAEAQRAQRILGLTDQPIHRHKKVGMVPSAAERQPDISPAPVEDDRATLSSEAHTTETDSTTKLEQAQAGIEECNRLAARAAELLAEVPPERNYLSWDADKMNSLKERLSNLDVELSKAGEKMGSLRKLTGFPTEPIDVFSAMGDAWGSVNSFSNKLQTEVAKIELTLADREAAKRIQPVDYGKFKRVDYLTVPSADGFFWADKVYDTFDQRAAVYKLLRESPTSITATYELVDMDVDSRRTKIESYTTYLLPVCDFDSTNRQGKYIMTLSPGELRLDGAKWVVTKKAKVRIVNEPIGAPTPPALEPELVASDKQDDAAAQPEPAREEPRSEPPAKAVDIYRFDDEFEPRLRELLNTPEGREVLASIDNLNSHFNELRQVTDTSDGMRDYVQSIEQALTLLKSENIDASAYSVSSGKASDALNGIKVVDVEELKPRLYGEYIIVQPKGQSGGICSLIPRIARSEAVTEITRDYVSPFFVMHEGVYDSGSKKQLLDQIDGIARPCLLESLGGGRFKILRKGLFAAPGEKPGKLVDAYAPAEATSTRQPQPHGPAERTPVHPEQREQEPLAPVVQIYKLQVAMARRRERIFEDGAPTGERHKYVEELRGTHVTIPDPHANLTKSRDVAFGLAENVGGSEFIRVPIDNSTAYFLPALQKEYRNDIMLQALKLFYELEGKVEPGTTPIVIDIIKPAIIQKDGNKWIIKRPKGIIKLSDKLTPVSEREEQAMADEIARLQGEIKGTQAPAKNSADGVVSPPVTERKPKPEGWADKKDGIRFTRELKPDEQKAKDEIDTEVRRRLAEKAAQLLKEPAYAGENHENFTAGFVERGMNHEKIVAARMAEYRKRNLPLMEQGGAAA